MKFFVLALAFFGAATAIPPLAYSGVGWGHGGWEHAGLGLHGGDIIDASVVSTYHAPTIVAAPIVKTIVPAPVITKTIVAAPAISHLGYSGWADHGVGLGDWGLHGGYAAPVWGIDAWKKKKAH